MVIGAESPAGFAGRWLGEGAIAPDGAVSPDAVTFLERLYPLLRFLVPQYEQEGKAYLTVGIGCTGGQHRSVALARAIGAWLQGELPGRKIVVRHRDMPDPATGYRLPATGR